MSTLHIFNPSHDESLAANTPYYTASKTAQILERDLACLPSWWGQKDDYVLLPGNHVLDGGELNGCYLVTNPCWEKISKVCPWGWDSAVVLRLKKLGCPQKLLPSDECVDMTRRLSCRKTTKNFLENNVFKHHHIIGRSWWVADVDDIMEILEGCTAVMVKAPWSCSGRGVFKVSRRNLEVCRSRILKIIKQQGAVEVEPFYEKELDFALEFEMDGTELRYLGMSVFKTAGIGGYAGNVVADENQLQGYIPLSLRKSLNEISKEVQTKLQTLLVHKYKGYVGVDMMIVKENGGLFVHPCVEINFRQTMGLVALRLRHLLGINKCCNLKIREICSLKSGELVLTPCGEKIQAVLTPLGEETGF